MTQESRSLTHGRSQGRGNHLLEFSRVHTLGRPPIEPNTDTLGEEGALINWRSPSHRVTMAQSGISCSHSRYFRVAPCQRLEARTLNWIEPFSTGGLPSRIPARVTRASRPKGPRKGCSAAGPHEQETNMGMDPSATRKLGADFVLSTDEVRDAAAPALLHVLIHPSACNGDSSEIGTR